MLDILLTPPGTSPRARAEPLLTTAPTKPARWPSMTHHFSLPSGRGALFPARFVARAVLGCVRSASPVSPSSPVVAALRLALARSLRLAALASHSATSAPFPNFTLDTGRGGGIVTTVDIRMSPSSNAMLLNPWACRQGITVFPTRAAVPNRSLDQRLD